MSTTNFMTPELNIDDATTSVSGEFVISDAPAAELIDTSNNLNLYVSKALMNQMFLFFSDNTTGNDNKADLSDFSDTDLKYALNVNQWNLKINTTKSDRKHVIKNLLIDIFGVGPADALQNIDVFSNEEELDNDISNIFQTKVSSRQRVNLTNTSNIHGSFIHNGTLKTLNHQKLLDASTNNNTSITAKLLQIASNASGNDGNNLSFRRQFDTTNTSNTEYSLPIGWRTFQFVDGDSISYNLSIKQDGNFFPEWSANANARINGGTATTYRIKLIVSTDPSGQTADFLVPNINIADAEIVSSSQDLQNIISNIVGQVDSFSNFYIVYNADPNILYQTDITAHGINFSSLGPDTKTNIIREVKQLYARRLNINPASILVTLSDGSLKINIKIYNKLLSSITLNGPSSVTIYQGDMYTEQYATALNDGIDVTNDLVIDSTAVDRSTPGTYLVTYTVPGTTLTASRQVIVVDNIKPIITLIPDANNNIDISLNIQIPYTEYRAIFTDLRGGINVDISDRLIISGSVDITKPGSYTITYSGTDTSNVSALPVNRTVTVIDNLPPVITLQPGDISLNQNDKYTEPGIISVTDVGDGDMSTNIIPVVTNSNGVAVNLLTFTQTAGVYTLTYSATDSTGNRSDVFRNVTVHDKTAPEITLKPPHGNIEISLNEIYIDSGIESVTDEGGDGDMSTNIIPVITNSSGVVVDATNFTQIAGIYTVTYTATDSKGNTSTKVRTVSVRDHIPPVISLNNGDLTLNMFDLISQPFVDPGVASVIDTGGDGTIIGAGPNTHSSYNINVTESNTAPNLYVLSGSDRTGTINGNNKTVHLNIGDTVIFNNTVHSSHPLWIKDVSAPGNVETNSLTTSNGQSSVSWTPTQAGVYYYNCQYHSAMVGKIVVSYITPSVTNNSDNSIANFATFTETAGAYTLTYTATDSAGNSSDASRNVTVVDNIIYDISVNTPSLDISINAGDSFTVPTGDLIRRNDGFVIGSAISSIYSINTNSTVNSIDTSLAGNYTITYSGSLHGRSASDVTLQVEVKGDPNDIINLTGQLNSVYQLSASELSKFNTAFTPSTGFVLEFSYYLYSTHPHSIPFFAFTDNPLGFGGTGTSTYSGSQGGQDTMIRGILINEGPYDGQFEFEYSHRLNNAPYGTAKVFFDFSQYRNTNTLYHARFVVPSSADFKFSTLTITPSSGSPVDITALNSYDTRADNAITVPPMQMMTIGAQWHVGVDRRNLLAGSTGWGGESHSNTSKGYMQNVKLTRYTNPTIQYENLTVFSTRTITNPRFGYIPATPNTPFSVSIWIKFDESFGMVHGLTPWEYGNAYSYYASLSKQGFIHAVIRPQGYELELGTRGPDNVYHHTRYNFTNVFSNEIITNQWHHLLITWSGLTATGPTIYVDGNSTSTISSIWRKQVSNNGTESFFNTIPSDASDHTWDIATRNTAIGGTSGSQFTITEDDSQVADIRIWDGVIMPYTLSSYTPPSPTPLFEWTGPITTPTELTSSGVFNAFQPSGTRFGFELMTKFEGGWRNGSHVPLSLTDENTWDNTDANGSVVSIAFSRQYSGYVYFDITFMDPSTGRAFKRIDSRNNSWVNGLMDDGLWHHVYCVADIADGTWSNTKVFLDGNTVATGSGSAAYSSFALGPFTRLRFNLQRYLGTWYQPNGGKLAWARFYGQDAPADTTGMTLTYS